MRQRMTDEEVGSAALYRVRHEARRARAAEAEKDKALAEKDARITVLEKAAIRASAELRHAFRNHAQGFGHDPNLVSRAISILEGVVSAEAAVCPACRTDGGMHKPDCGRRG